MERGEARKLSPPLAFVGGAWQLSSKCVFQLVGLTVADFSLLLPGSLGCRIRGQMTMSHSKKVELTAEPLKSMAFALFYGVLCHALFFASIAVMVQALYFGLTTGLGPFRGAGAVVANALLVLQFPLIHSWLLSDQGRTFQTRLVPFGLGRKLSTTTYVLLASLQLLLAFGLWSPSGVIWWRAEGILQHFFTLAFALSWLLLALSMQQAGLGVQMGYLGWLSVVRQRRAVFPKFATQGLFQWCRQPIYFSFALTLWTGPVWTPDHLFLAAFWTLYSVIGPVFKERRYRRYYGADYEAYQALVSYWVPLGRKVR